MFIDLGLLLKFVTGMVKSVCN